MPNHIAHIRTLTSLNMADMFNAFKRIVIFHISVQDDT